ncbi:MAG: LysE family translocator [Proteobacteria bacterium]|nr:LysE family translocator [Pseudomonadota bacterium]
MTAYGPLAVFALAAALSPGGATTLATSSGVRFGFRRSLPLLMGIVTGMASLGALSGAGLAELLLAVPSLKLAVQAAGSAYLLWLAWKVATSPPRHGTADLARPTRFGGSLCLLWLNPKGWAVTLSAAGSFASLAPDAVHLSILLGSAFAGAAAVSMAFWCAAGAALARALTTDLHWRLTNGILGVLLAASIIPMWLER